MGSGRTDYWYGHLPGQSILGVSQTSWYVLVGHEIDPSGYVQVIEYTVPIGYRLYITGAHISSDLPGMEFFAIWVDDVAITAGYYDGLSVLPGAPLGGYILGEGQVLEVWAKNTDGKKRTVYCSMVGYEEYRIG